MCVSKSSITFLLLRVLELRTPFPSLPLPLFFLWFWDAVAASVSRTTLKYKHIEREKKKIRSRQKTLLLLRGGHWQQTKRCSAAQWKRIYCLLHVPWRTVVCAYLQQAIMHTVEIPSGGFVSHILYCKFLSHCLLRSLHVLNNSAIGLSLKQVWYQIVQQFDTVTGYRSFSYSILKWYRQVLIHF